MPTFYKSLQKMIGMSFKIHFLDWKVLLLEMFSQTSVLSFSMSMDWKGRFFLVKVHGWPLICDSRLLTSRQKKGNPSKSLPHSQNNLLKFHLKIMHIAEKFNLSVISILVVELILSWFAKGKIDPLEFQLAIFLGCIVWFR